MTVYYDNPIKVDIQGRSVFVDGEPHPFTVRNLSQLNEVLMHQGKPEKDFPLYFMYRSIIEGNGMRYDITIIPPKVINGEFCKTYGHYHPTADGLRTYPELYQVLEGTAMFVLQRIKADGGAEVIITYGEKGDVVFIPPNFGHVTINPSKDKTLVMGNLVYGDFQSDYAGYKENKGAAYYVTENGLEHNTNYIIKKMDKFEPRALNAKYGVDCKDIFKEFTQDPAKFEYLKVPGLLRV